MAKPTIGDVARVAGVTRATVSHAYSGKRSISAPTKARVFEAAESLGWVPSHSARALATRRANAVGLVIARDPGVIASDSFFPAFIAGLESGLADAEVALLLQVAASRSAEERAYRSMAHGKADGVIVIDLHRSDWRVAFLAELGLTAVLLGAYEQESPFSCVRSDDAVQMRDLITHLRGLGHERIAHVTGPLGYVHSHARARAYVEEIGSEELLREGDFGAASGRDLTGELLDLTDRPTAVLYANDTMAIAGLSLARSRDFRVPDDLALAGFDDDHLSAHLSPALTSVATDPFRRGRITAEVLLADIDGATPGSVEIDCNELRLRASTAAPAPSIAQGGDR
ncbi:LacI family DNA-binding transcriptional regulator [Occultella aeris]|uniref:HTH-type transcriptional repressor CytR n=1 Tax=Occultella aeris TaxID=2761496 RepID=A0A7M4DQP9_9MICO|nr:LacI family DNA-binding transcriptional regulator [Occultella aeris]VZO39793.1 HTH-type transcriptional repressor CytR [Occultella aeris]